MFNFFTPFYRPTKPVATSKPVATIPPATVGGTPPGMVYVSELGIYVPYTAPKSAPTSSSTTTQVTVKSASLQAVQDTSPTTQAHDTVAVTTTNTDELTVTTTKPIATTTATTAVKPTPTAPDSHSADGAKDTTEHTKTNHPIKNASHHQASAHQANHTGDAANASESKDESDHDDKSAHNGQGQGLGQNHGQVSTAAPDLQIDDLLGGHSQNAVANIEAITAHSNVAAAHHQHLEVARDVHAQHFII